MLFVMLTLLFTYFIMKFYYTVLQCFHEELLIYIVNESIFSLLLYTLKYDKKSHSIISSAVWKTVIKGILYLFTCK